MKHDIPILAPPHKLRPGSDRALRFIRLAWLTGRRTSEIAVLLKVSPRTVSRSLTRHGLRGPGRPGETARLLAEVILDSAVDGYFGGEAAKTESMLAWMQKLSGSLKAMGQAPGLAQTEEKEDTDTDDWEQEIEDEIDRLVAMDRAMAAGTVADSADNGQGGAVRVETKSHKALPLPARMPRYAGAAAGPCADVVAFGRTWRGQDAGGRGICALGGAAGGVSPGGAGGAELFGCARGDDRGAERPDPDGDAPR